MGRDLGGSHRGLIWGNISEYVWKDWEKPQRPSVKTIGMLANVRNGYLQVLPPTYPHCTPLLRQDPRCISQRRRRHSFTSLLFIFRSRSKLGCSPSMMKADSQFLIMMECVLHQDEVSAMTFSEAILCSIRFRT
jgi:hypothetical protein